MAEFAPDRGEQFGADREGEPVSARHAPDTGDEPAECCPDCDAALHGNELHTANPALQRFGNGALAHRGRRCSHIAA